MYFITVFTKIKYWKYLNEVFTCQKIKKWFRKVKVHKTNKLVNVKKQIHKFLKEII